MQIHEYNHNKTKYDEYYTTYDFIESEMQYYISNGVEVFNGKTVLCPCDDPQQSNYTKYFINNFNRLGLKKLISTCYKSGIGGRGKILTVTRDNIGGVLADVNLYIQSLNGSGDFRGAEISALRDISDFVITNPPFSLLIEFFNWLYWGGV